MLPHKKNTLRAVMVTLVAGLLAIAGTSAATAEVESSVSIPVETTVSATATDCENSPGPYITLSGEMTLGSVTVDLIFRNNDRGTHEHEETTEASVELSLEDDTVSFPKQPVQGGVGGNPFIWIQFLDSDGNEMSDELYLGRCVQGLDEVSAGFSLPADASLTVNGDQCENNPGPYITLEGEVALTGVDARLIFRNNDNPVGGPHEHTEEASVDIVIIPDGETIKFNKQPVWGGVGGNPKVWVRVETADGTSDEIYLGRCVQDL